MVVFDTEGSVLVLEVKVGAAGGFGRLAVAAGGGVEVTSEGAGGAGINLSIFSHSALTCPWMGTGETKGVTNFEKQLFGSQL